MPEVICIGECLIDFVSKELDKPIGECREFKKAAGGAPANVAVGLAKLGIESGLIGKVGQDDFGHFLQNTLIKHNVNMDNFILDKDVRTTLAFIATRSDGGKSILFYRNPGADMMLRVDNIDIDFVKTARILHLGSVSMSQEPSRKATFYAIEVARKSGVTISLDPNLRLSLWPSQKQAKEIVLEAIKQCDILKCNMEEIQILTETERWQEGTNKILDMGVKLVVVTDADKGCYYNNYTLSGAVPSFDVNPIDFLGAGDSFTSALLYMILKKNMLPSLQEVNGKELYTALEFANAVGAIATLKKGAIPSLPGVLQIQRFIRKNKTGGI